MVVDRYVDTVLGRIGLRVSGSGPAMLFWPSLLMDGDLWTGQSSYFADRFQVIVVDPPGHGASSPLTRTFTFAECARVVVQILDALSIDRTHMIGNSWGGMIGGTFAATYPTRVGVSILMNATASPAGLRQKVEFAALTRMSQVLGGIRGPLVKPVLGAFLGPTALRDKPAVVATVNESVRRVLISSGRRAVTSVVPRRPDQRELFGRITTPVLVVAGAEDATFPVAETRAMADAIPGSHFVVLDKAAHLAALECPAEVNPLIEEFAATHS